MSRKAVIFFSIWTSFWSALFNALYGFFPVLGGIPWVMFVCLAVFFGMGLGPKDAPSLALSGLCGCAWGQVDFLLITLFCGICGLSDLIGGFLAVILGTFVTMVLHIHFLEKTPLRHVPIIFAGVALTFSQGGSNTLGLVLSMMVGITLAGICGWGMQFAIKKFNT